MKIFLKSTLYNKNIIIFIKLYMKKRCNLKNIIIFRNGCPGTTRYMFSGSLIANPGVNTSSAGVDPQHVVEIKIIYKLMWLIYHYMYIHTYTHTHTHIHTHSHTYHYSYHYMYIHTYTHIHPHLHTHTPHGWKANHLQIDVVNIVCIHIHI